MKVAGNSAGKKIQLLSTVVIVIAESTNQGRRIARSKMWGGWTHTASAEFWGGKPLGAQRMQQICLILRISQTP